jgi:hypothetical protein
MKGDRPGWRLRKRAGIASKEASSQGKFRILSLSLDLNSEPNVDRTGDGNYVWKIHEMDSAILATNANHQVFPPEN